MAKARPVKPAALEGFVSFRDEDFYAAKIHDSDDMRALAFCFKPGQETEPVEVRPSVMLYALRGEGFFTVGKKEYPVQAGDFVVVPPREAHGVRASRRGEFVVLVVLAPSPTGLIG